MREERERLERLLEEERAERRRLQEELYTERSKGFLAKALRRVSILDEATATLVAAEIG